MKKVMITGTSQGLGKALAEEFTKRNYQVIATARNFADIQINGVYKKVALDITKPKMIEEVLSDMGNIDILVNNAGISISGPAEAIPQTDAKRIFEVNFFGTVEMMKSVIPTMRNNGNGTIVNISSSAAQFAPLYGGYYSASKAALELVSEELRFELKHFGIEVLVMQCGAIDTKISMQHQMYESEVYAELDKQMKEGFETYKKRNDRPSATSMAIQIIEAIEQEHRPFKTVLGKDAAYMLDLRKKLGDAEWEEQSPFIKNIDW